MRSTSSSTDTDTGFAAVADTLGIPSGDIRPNGHAQYMNGASLVMAAPPERSNGRSSSASPPPAGHNSGASDPGPATDFEDKGPLAIRKESVPPESLEAFYEAIRSQGDAGVRQWAISNTLARSRANSAIKHHDAEAIASRREIAGLIRTMKALETSAQEED